MTEPILTGPESARAARPPQLPDKFWDEEAGNVRLEALLKSYLELERRLSAPPDRASLLKILGVPDTPDGYCVECSHGLFEPDPEINGRLHAAGLTPEQVQLVYDLAAERLVPMIQDIAADMGSERELERLVAHFGGEDSWRETSRQILAWARKNLPSEAIDSLSGSYDGILALHRLMSGGEPAALRPGRAPDMADEAELHRLMRDPRYWRDRDPGVVNQVTEGFRRLYSER